MFKCAMLFPILLVYFVWRILFLLFAHPLHLFIYAEEEFYRGWIGKEILEGLKLSLWDYRADDYSGGSLWMGVVSAGVFKVFGISALSFKLIPVFIYAGVLAGWYVFLAHFLNRRVALLASLLLIFSPLLFTRFALTALGDHPETMAFTALALFPFFKILQDGPRVRFVYPVLLGLLSGFGLWTAYIYGITLIAFAIYWILQDKAFFKRFPFWIALIFFMIGFSPWLISNLTGGFQGFVIHGTPLLELFNLKSFAKRILNFRHSSIYMLFAVHGIPGVVPEFSPVAVMRVYRFLYLIPWMLLAAVFCKEIMPRLRQWFSGRGPAQFALLYLGVFAVVTQFTEFRDLRYFIPAQPFIVFLAVYAADRFASVLKPALQNVFRFGYFALLVGLSLFLHFQIFYPEFTGFLLKMKPLSPQWFLLSPNCASPEQCYDTYSQMKWDKSTNPEERAFFISGISQKLLEDLPFRDPYAELLDLKRRLPSEFHRYLDYYFGYETYWREYFRDPSADTLGNALSAMTPLKNTAHASYETAVLGMFRHPFPELKLSAEVMRRHAWQIPAAALPEFWRRNGYQWANEIVRENTSSGIFKPISEMLTMLSDEERKYFLQGAGHLFYDVWYLKPYAHKSRLHEAEVYPEKIKKEIFRGAGYGWASQKDVLSAVYLEMIQRVLSPAAFEIFRSGAVLEGDFYKGLRRV